MGDNKLLKQDAKNVLPIALTPKKTLLIGAGAVAKQKYQVLKEAGFEIQICAKEIKDAFFSPLSEDIVFAHFGMSEEMGYTIMDREWHEDISDFISKRGFGLVVDASGDGALGQFLFAYRRKGGYLLNVVDMPHLCDFYFGAITRKGEVSVLVSSNGASPLLAQNIRDKIATLLPKAIASFSYMLQKSRTKPLGAQAKQSIRALCKENLGKVFIIGCGPNKLSSLTLKAFESLSLLDVALLDNLVGEEIWAYLEHLGVECINVGKAKGKHSFKQEAINALMLQYAREGKCVGRLKGGDPALFGRVWEEVSFLQKQGVECECIAGLSSSLCGALSAGIVPTLRGVSSGVLIVSAHLRENIFHAEWLTWLLNSPFTFIVMMAHSFASRIVAYAKDLGISLSIPAAFVSQVDCREQKAVIGSLGQLEQMAAMVERPAILILGEAVKSSLSMPYAGQRIVLPPLKQDFALGTKLRLNAQNDVNNARIMQEV
ncbi:siroheme synthase [Helicobacter marmotae]|uniref:Uroporphyrinogen-III C-methyltransferase n=1 Tax=Helicobacter marmotae TaxID=152490 RepID=A0A3D8I360_9HELI|nr:SAM-dependent methyltransferase [Helicobacter marmotae]RDU59552.1 uroporphyrinogen-III C-methyltransferase [Helicobacter marmotae]